MGPIIIWLFILINEDLYSLYKLYAHNKFLPIRLKYINYYNIFLTFYVSKDYYSIILGK